MMLSLKETLDTVHKKLDEIGVEHALIGGFGLSAHRVFRATQDIDMMIDEKDRDKVIDAFVSTGWRLFAQTTEVLHFDQPGLVDFLLARRPMSRTMLQNAKPFGAMTIKAVSAEGLIGLKIQAYKNNPNREYRDKADIQALIKNNSNLDWHLIKSFADLFDEWWFIESLKGKV